MRRAILVLLIIMIAGCTESNVAGEAYNIGQYVTQGATRTISDTDANLIGDVGEAGTAAGIRYEFTEVRFSRSYNDPVVVVGPITYNGGQPAHARVKDVTSDGFLVRVEEWYDLDGSHLDEELSYLVMERGTHNIAGKQIVADSVKATTAVQTVELQGFAEVPVILASITTLNGPVPLVPRIINYQNNMFSVQTQQEENNQYCKIVLEETVDYIALEKGSYGNAVAALTGREVTHVWNTIEFDLPANHFVASMQSTFGGDTANLRQRNRNTNTVEIMVQEEQSRDNEVVHTTEVVGYFIVGGEVREETPISPATLRFGNTNSAELQPIGMNYVEDGNDVLGDYLVIDDAKPFVEFTFPLNATELMGESYTVLDRVHPNVLIKEGVTATIIEGETLTLTVDGTDYEVTLAYVSDSGAEPTAKFMVNGEVTDELQWGDTDQLSGGAFIGVNDVNNLDLQGTVVFILGTGKLSFDDATRDGISFDGRAEVNDEYIEDADVAIVGSTVFYRLSADPILGSIMYMPAGSRLSTLLDEPEGLLGFDLVNHGLEQTPFSTVAVEPVGNGHQLTINRDGTSYNIPLFHTVNSSIMLGDADDDLIMQENRRVGDDDYFVLNGAEDGVYRFDDIDTTDRVVTFTSIHNGGITREFAYQPGTSTFGTFNFIHRGQTYAMDIENVNGNYYLHADLNGDGAKSTDWVSLHPQKGFELRLEEGRLILSGQGEKVDIQYEVVNGAVEIAQIGYDGPRVQSGQEFSQFSFYNDDANDDFNRARTDYGTRIDWLQPIGERYTLTLSIPDQELDAIIQGVGIPFNASMKIRQPLAESELQ